MGNDPTENEPETTARQPAAQGRKER